MYSLNDYRISRKDENSCRTSRLHRNFKKLVHKNGLLEKEKFKHALVEEVLESALKKCHFATLQRYEDLSHLGVLQEVWGACFGEKDAITFAELLTVFETEGQEKSEAEKLLDLCSEDDALRNHVFDLEQCLQSNKDMLAASDILVEEQAEKVKSLEEDLQQITRENEQLCSNTKELEALKTKIKNMESEHRLLKRDFDLVFATNKSVQKKIERAELENTALRKTIITLANQMEKNAREQTDIVGHSNLGTASPVVTIPMSANDSLHAQLSPHANFMPTNDQHTQNYSGSFQPQHQTARPHMVWDPAVRTMVPITGDPNQMPSPPTPRTPPRKKAKQNKRWRDNSGVTNGKLISPFPRRYTSSHLPRYRRKFEIAEKSRYDRQSAV